MAERPSFEYHGCMTGIKVTSKSYLTKLVDFKHKTEVENTFTLIHNNYIGVDNKAKKEVRLKERSQNAFLGTHKNVCTTNPSPGTQ